MEWKRGPVIGRGSSATVHLATTTSGDLFAIKSTTLSNSTPLQKEQQILSQLNSPNVISYIDHNITYNNNKPMFNLFIEYAPFGTIRDIIKKHNGSLKESLIKSYIRQILMGLDHIHSNNLVHCDIKCENILVSDQHCVKIGDMGSAKFVEKNGVKESSFYGTPVFMAPEVARGEKQGFESDVWSVGCVVIEMATGLNPWPEINDLVSGLFKIGFSGEVPVVPAWLSSECKDFLGKCLEFDGKERWSVKELLGHPFVSGLEKVEEFTKNSPTSVLDQKFWGAVEVPESLPEIIFPRESPVEWIRQLVGGSCLCLPNWIDDDDWIIVRSNDITESTSIESTRIESTSTESSSFSNFHIDESLKIFEDDGTESTCTESSSFSKFLVEESLKIYKNNIIESSRDMSTHTTSSSFSNSYFDRIGSFNFLMSENDVEGSNQSNVFESKFIDFVKIFDDNYLGLKLLIYDDFINLKCVIVYK